MNPQEETLSDSLAFLLAQQGWFDYAVRGLDLWLGPKKKTVETDLITVRIEDGRSVVSCIETKIHTDRDGRRNELAKQVRMRERAKIFDEIWIAWDSDESFQCDPVVSGQGTIFIDSFPANEAAPTARIKKLASAARRTPERGDIWFELRKRLAQFEDCVAMNADRFESRPPVFVRCPGCKGDRSFYYAFELPPTYSLVDRNHAPFCGTSTGNLRSYNQFMASIELIRNGRSLASVVQTAMTRTD